MKSYPLNNLNGKNVDLKLIACPVIFAQEKLIGAWIYEQTKKKKAGRLWLEKTKICWYESTHNSAGSGRVIYPIRQTVNVDYPILVYKGFTLDNRELVMVNLADH